MKYFSNIILLISNGGVMLCCVFPAIMVMLGLGGTLVTLFQDYPILLKIGMYKNYIFSTVFLLLLLNFFLIKKQEKDLCDLENLEECRNTKKVSKKLFMISLIIFIISFSLSYLS